MLYAQINKSSNIIKKIRDYYIQMYERRLYSNAKRKYTRIDAERNIRNALSFIGNAFDDNQLRNPILISWQRRGLKELIYNNWHLGVIVQLDMFGNNIAIVQDCCHNNNYHNDVMQTEPFKMDTPNDMSHLVDWKEHRLNAIITETINKYLKNNLIRV